MQSTVSFEAGSTNITNIIVVGKKDLKHIGLGTKKDATLDHTERHQAILLAKCCSMEDSNCNDFTLAEVKLFQETFVLGKSEKERDIAISNHVVVNCPVDSQGRRTYYLANKKVCRKRFLQLLQCSERKFTRLMNSAQRKEELVRSHPGKESVTKFFNDLMESGELLDNDPASEDTLKLSCEFNARQDLYLKYYEHCQEKGCKMVDRSTFGKIWRKEFPKVFF